MARKSAKSASSATAEDAVALLETEPAEPREFRVSLKGYPVTGFVDRYHDADGESVVDVYSKSPVERHFRPRDADAALDDGIGGDGWFTARQLQELYGLSIDELDGKKWKSRPRVRMDLTTALFEGVVIKAYSASQAREIFCRLYGVNDTNSSNWIVKPHSKDSKFEESRVGDFFGPKKMRGLLRQD